MRAFALTAIAGLFVVFALESFAAPAGMTVQSGTASLSQSGNQLNITASHNAFLNWNSFNIAPNETTTFIQPSAASVVWNRINDPNPSQIFGSLNANGVVVLMNQSGFYFGPNSVVNAAGLIVSTAPVTTVESSAGLFWQFNGAPPQASIVNYGCLNAGRAGSLFLIADRIENHGTLNAPEGNIGLLAGREVLLTDRPDGLGLSATVRLPSGSVDNSGRIIADAGTIALQAQVVNQNGLVQANSIRERNGVIELVASDAITLGNNSVLSAGGDQTGTSAGGRIEIKSAGSFSDSASSRIHVAGGAQAGDGGFVEVSAPVMDAIQSQIDGHASAGSTGGRLVIDPQDIVIGTTGLGSAGSGTVGSGDPPVAGALNLNVNSAFLGFSQIDLQATRNISISASTMWNLPASTGLNVPGSLLKLEAGNNITIANNTSIFAGDNWSVTLQAGRNFALADTVRSGVGTITFTGNASLQTGAGNISLLAGNSVTVNSGFVRTVGGGNIAVMALSGSVNTGTRGSGFIFNPGLSYAVDPNLGGISTANGGNVNITAGQDILSFLPPYGGALTDAGSGAFGAAPGNVTLTAGRDIAGHFVVHNGVGTATAGRHAGNTSRALALTLGSGSWDVRATSDLLVRDVHSPAALAQVSEVSAPGTFVTLEAGNNLTLAAGARVLGSQGWAVTLQAGRNFALPNNVRPGFGTISLPSDSLLQTQDGALTLLAGNGISLGSGQVGSTAGGRVNLTTLAGNIDIPANLAWTLPDLASPATSLLTLESGGDINLGDNASITAGQGWSVTLQAGRDFTAPNTALSGVGNIWLAGGSSIEAQNGAINLLAGNNVTVESGFVRTVGGGSITARAVSGDVNTGTRPNGFLFLPTGYQVDADLGGISTANGGNVSLTAGHDITSYLPVDTGFHTDGGSGAFGAAPGNVTLTAANDVYGHFVVRNGTGTIIAGRDAGKRGSQLDKLPGAQPPDGILALSVVNGGWDVTAGGFIFLQEVRNPNGIFNKSGSGSSTIKHFFDYSPIAYTILNATRGVQLLGTALPRNGFEDKLPSIYPGRLEITAGAEGVTLGNDVTLFPSPVGNLRITTTDGGSLVSTKPGGDLANLIVSDSGKTQYREAGDFGVADHGPTLLHLNDPEPVRLDIAGDMIGILLGVPKCAEINVGGNMINSRFDGQNLHAGDVTRINVAGDIINRNEFTSVTVATAPDFSLFDIAYPPLSGSVAGLGNQFYYNARTHQLTFQGRMDGFQVEALMSLSVRTFDANGLPIVSANGEPVTRQVQILSSDLANQLYTLSQDVPLNPDTGYRIGGGGQFNITARNLDLGATAGISSQGPRANAALAQHFTRGADINVSLSGDLEMFSTTISSLNGGNVTVVAGGSVSVGSKDFHGNDTVARGIFTTDPSDVTVIARGNIDVNGSRIAAYDGGNVTVRSLEGNVDAGTGGLGSVSVEKIYVDPITREIKTYTPTIPGSGVLATTFPASLDATFPRSVNTVGDILVETPRGSIIASAGGVVQIPLNGIGNNLGTVTLNAGTTHIGPDGKTVVDYVGNIDASGSGVIGSTVKLEASGDIKGVVFARQNLDVSANQNVNVTALAVGNANVSGGESVSGTIIGVGSVTATGANVDAALLSQNITGGTSTSGQVGFSQGTAANATSQSLQKEDPEKTATSSKKNDDEEELKKKSVATLPRLTRTVGRVTVILPTP